MTLVFAGDSTDAADINAIEPVWTDYTPVFSTPSGAPTIGTGGGAALIGRHHKFGKKCVVTGYLKFGTSGASAGTGEFRISLPFTAATVTDEGWLGKIYINDATAGAAGHFHGVAIVLSGATYMTFAAGNAGAQVLNNAPIPWAGGDHFRFTVEYETT